MTTITMNGLQRDYSVRDSDCIGRECLRLGYAARVKDDRTGEFRCITLGDCPSPLPGPSAALRRRRQNDGMAVRP